MRRRLAFATASLCFLVLFALVIWQGSFRFPYDPTDLRETVVLWAASTVVFVLTVTLAFMLLRMGVKLYIERQRDKEGSRIRSKLLIGALALTITPVLFSVLFSVYVLNRTLDKWFNRPARQIQLNLQDVDKAFKSESQDRAMAGANWISLLPQTVKAAQTGQVDSTFFDSFCKAQRLRQITLTRSVGKALVLCESADPIDRLPPLSASSDVMLDGAVIGRVTGRFTRTADLSTKENAIQSLMNEQNQFSHHEKFYQDTYFMVLCLITLFVLFFASWSAQLFSKQISVPIAALLAAAQEVRQGNLGYRIKVQAMDELATLVRAFNEMTRELNSNAHELELRRRFTEAILESIPTGVISVSAEERIERVNRAMSGIFPPDVVSSAKRLQDLFTPEDVADIRYLMKRARRTGASACQLEIQRESSVIHLAVTVASIEEQRGFVLVLEDTSDLLRAQKSAAWQEVARRIAHEIKNPLTPISLCADRIARHLARTPIPEGVRAILDECTQTIQQEVQTVKTLVDEFWQYSRFPAAHPTAADLNEIVESAMAVFAGRLEGIDVALHLSPKLPQVLADREQVKRVIVNLVDNAAEAMSQSAIKRLEVTTVQTGPDVVEISVADSGSGVSASDKEKLFLPYFSTKQRGTGLGLAIVSHIVSEHHGRVRVVDHVTGGARFIVELNTFVPSESANHDGVGGFGENVRAGRGSALASVKA